MDKPSLDIVIDYFKKINNDTAVTQVTILIWHTVALLIRWGILAKQN